jgi:glycosyltransferase involved in cell wall biosynthesis
VLPQTNRQQKRNLFSRGRYKVDVPDSPFMDGVLKWMVRHNVEHLHGPSEVDYGLDELVVLVLLRNGRPYVKPFVEHYFALGAKHIVFLDNGSTDGTVEALKAYDDQNITVLRSGLPFKKYNIAMKQYLVERFGRGRWTLSTDMDELFEYPYSDVVSLKALLGYLNEHSYTAVVTYMLDMFPETLLPAEGPEAEYEDLKELYRFYDISDVRTRDYNEGGDIGNVVSNGQIEILQGGVIERIFKTSPLLTKHPLVFMDDQLRPHDLSDHWAGNARIADFTAVFLHYKLSANLYELVRREIEERRYVNRHGKYDKMHKILAEAPTLLMRSETSKELRSVNDLVGTRFVSLSEQYLSFVENEARRSGNYSEEDRSERLSEAFFNARAEVAAYSRKTRELQQELKKTRARSRRGRAASRSARHAEERVDAIQSSRAWKVLTAIHRLKLGAAQALDRVRGGAQKRA